MRGWEDKKMRRWEVEKMGCRFHYSNDQIGLPGILYIWKDIDKLFFKAVIYRHTNLKCRIVNNFKNPIFKHTTYGAIFFVNRMPVSLNLTVWNFGVRFVGIYLRFVI